MATNVSNNKSGLFIAVLGPDGSGKSTLVSGILDKIGTSYKKTWRFHWRPSLLPKLSRSKHSTGLTISAPPPDKAAYGVIISFFRYTYYLMDFILGYWLNIYPRKLRNTLVIGERWYYDVIVHPARYGFALPQWLLRLGSYLLPKPDLTVLLEADPAAIHARKPELSVQQIRSQLDQFLDLLPAAPKGQRLWTGGDIEESIQAFTDAVQAASTRHTDGPSIVTSSRQKWSGFPSSTRPKLWINYADSLSNAFRLYQPYSVKGRLAKLVFAHLPRSLTMRGSPDSPELQRLMNLTEFICKILRENNLIVSFSTGTPGPCRKITAQVSHANEVIAYVKIGHGSRVRNLLDNEITTLRYLETLDSLHGTVPRVLYNETDCKEQFLFLSAPNKPGKQRQIDLDSRDVQFIELLLPQNAQLMSIEEFFTGIEHRLSPNAVQNKYTQSLEILLHAQEAVTKLLQQGILVGPCHGDFAPWNTLELADGSLYVFDWEYANQDAPLLMDLFHRIFMPQWLVRKQQAFKTVQRLLDLWSDPTVASLIKKSTIPREQAPAYLLLYLINQALLKLDSEGAIPSYLEDCIHHTLVHAGHPAHRRRVLVSAYACEPDKGSEAGVGWHWVNEISHSNEVWVITRKNNRKSLERELEARPNPQLHFAYTDLPYWLSFWKRGPKWVRTYYYLWQFAALIKARTLHREKPFDLGHHVTFVNDWLWTFLALMPLPYVWGPIGSHPPCPRILHPHLRARFQETLRLLIQRTARLLDPLYWLTAARASVVIAVTKDTVKQAPLRWLAKERYIVESAIGMDLLPTMDPNKKSNCTILYVGRFHYVKCPHLVIEVFSILAKVEPNATLLMLGSGPEEDYLRYKVDKLGLKDRVQFLGWVKRAEALDFMREATVFLFPSAEGAGMVVLEAMANGLPVVCLDIGGPGQMVGPECGVKVPLGTFKEMTEGLGNALQMLCKDPEKRAAMAARAQDRVHSRYTWKHKREVLNTAYDRAYRKNTFK